MVLLIVLPLVVAALLAYLTNWTQINYCVILMNFGEFLFYLLEIFLKS
jgi:hypothetical protein